MTITEFWPAVHQLREFIDDEGLTLDERLDSVVAKFCDLSPTAQRQLLTDVLKLSMELPDVYSAVSAAVSYLEEHGSSSEAG